MGTKWGTKVSAGLAVTAVSALAVGGVAVAGHGEGGNQRFEAEMKAVPHDPEADHASNVTGHARIMRRGDHVRVRLHAEGVSPKLPHAMHIHGKDAGELAFCPGAHRRAGLVDDGLIETAEGLDDYGPVQVSFTTSGDTRPGSGLALDRMPLAKGNGKLTYRRAIDVPPEVAQHLDEKHIVVHGHDIDRDGAYDPDPITALGAPLEAELPVACGEIRGR